MPTYRRWRKAEGANPLRGPWIVIRSVIEMHDWYTQRDMAFPERYRRYEFGWYWSERFYFKFQFNTMKRVYYD